MLKSSRVLVIIQNNKNNLGKLKSCVNQNLN